RVSTFREGLLSQTLQGKAERGSAHSLLVSLSGACATGAVAAWGRCFVAPAGRFVLLPGVGMRQAPLSMTDPLCFPITPSPCLLVSLSQPVVQRNDCRASPGLYGRSPKADHVGSTAIKLIHLRSAACRESQPVSRVRSVWILDVPLGNVIHNWLAG